jgi:peptidoglycan/LPS O-acetylase OafA/YrhL
MVAVFHYLGITQADAAWGQEAASIFPSTSLLAPYGWLGVDIFFVISGFVICMSCWGRTPGDFLRSRVARLYPAYWAGVCLTYLVVSVAPVLLDERPTFAEAILNLTMLAEPFGAERVDAVYWTLWVELRFYLLFALLAWGGLSYRRVVLFSAAWTTTSAIAQESDSDLLNVLTIPEFSSFFILGIGLYLLYRFGHEPITWLVIGASFAICLWRLQGRMWESAREGANSEMHYWLVALIFFLAVSFILAMASGRLSWMSWRWLTVAGALTYPFYLVHQYIGYSLIRHLYADQGISAYIVLPVTLCSMLLLAWLLHRLVERPLSSLLKRQFNRISMRELLRPRRGD